MNEARDGTHSGTLQYVFSKRTPRSASRWMFGVLMNGCPNGSLTNGLCSSVMMIRMFGLSEAIVTPAGRSKPAHAVGPPIAGGPAQPGNRLDARRLGLTPMGPVAEAGLLKPHRALELFAYLSIARVIVDVAHFLRILVQVVQLPFWWIGERPGARQPHTVVVEVDELVPGRAISVV